MRPESYFAHPGGRQSSYWFNHILWTSIIICNGNRTDWSTIQGVIGQVISNQSSVYHSADLKLWVRSPLNCTTTSPITKNPRNQGVPHWQVKSSGVKQNKIYTCQLALTGVKGLTQWLKRGCQNLRKTFKADRLQRIVVAKKKNIYIHLYLCCNGSSVGCPKCVLFYNWFRQVS